MSISRFAAVRTACLAGALALSLAACQPPGAEDPAASTTPPASVSAAGSPAASSSAPAPTPTPSASAPAAPSATPAGSPATKQLPAACLLISKAEAESLVGTQLSAPSVNNGQACTYPPVPSGVTAQLEIYTKSDAEALLQSEKAEGHQLSPLAGVGDEAYVSSVDSTYVRKGTTWVAVRIVRNEDQTVTASRLQKAAKLVATRF